jgi:hypothetical protein
MDDTHAQLLARIESLEGRLGRMEDIEAVKKLTRMYGYYLDKALWHHVLPLFTDDCEVEISALGVYAGKAQAEVLFREVLGKGPAMSDEHGLLHGRLFNHLILQGIVHIGDDGRTAQGRWRAFVQVAEFGKSAVWGEGPYEMAYRKDDEGRWRIRRLHFFRTYHTPFDQGWAKAASPKGGLRAAHPPSRPPSIDYDPFPAVFVPPFHYRHPITGE